MRENMKDAGSQRTQRWSNIELLRIITALGVIVLHYNNPNIGRGFRLVESKGNMLILALFQATFICAVNIFVLISGYFMRHSGKRDLLKPIELITQLLVFEFLFMGIKEIAAGGELQAEKILSYFRPSYWFVFVYAALYLISPFINVAWDAISAQGRKIILILMLGLFSIYPTILDMTGYITQFDMSGFNTVGLSGAQAGYSIVNFVLMYMIGLYLRDRKDRDGEIVPGRMKVVLLLLLNILIILIWSILDQTVFNRHTALIPAWAYYNPFVITEASLFFLAFNRLKLKNSRVINSLAAASFPSYLIHINLLEYCKIEQAVKANPLILTAHIILCPVVIYLTSYLIYTVYMTVFRPIFGMIGQRWKRHRKYEIKSE